MGGGNGSKDRMSGHSTPIGTTAWGYVRAVKEGRRSHRVSATFIRSYVYRFKYLWGSWGALLYVPSKTCKDFEVWHRTLVVELRVKAFGVKRRGRRGILVRCRPGASLGLKCTSEILCLFGGNYDCRCFFSGCPQEDRFFLMVILGPSQNA